MVEEPSSLKKIIWDLFDHPKSSRSALLIALTSVTMTIIAILLLCVETLPYFKKTTCPQSVCDSPSLNIVCYITVYIIKYVASKLYGVNATIIIFVFVFYCIVYISRYISFSKVCGKYFYPSLSSLPFIFLFSYLFSSSFRPLRNLSSC